jgi:hypothetical protein
VPVFETFLLAEYCFRDLVKASVEGGAAPAELEQHLYHRFHPPPVRFWEGVVASFLAGARAIEKAAIPWLITVALFSSVRRRLAVVR